MRNELISVCRLATDRASRLGLLNSDNSENQHHPELLYPLPQEGIGVSGAWCWTEHIKEQRGTNFNAYQTTRLLQNSTMAKVLLTGKLTDDYTVEEAFG
jgi:hypothetical protein